MKDEQESSVTKGLFLGFIAGGVVGAITALLYAPKSGKDFRRDIRTQRDRLVDKATDFLNATADAESEFMNAGQERTKEIITAARERANTILANAEKTLANAKTKAADKIEAAQSLGGKMQSAAKAGMDAFRDELKKD